MKFLECCFICHRDLDNDEWQIMVVYNQCVVLRCPYCKSIHNCSVDGTVLIYKHDSGGNDAYSANE